MQNQIAGVMQSIHTKFCNDTIEEAAVFNFFALTQNQALTPVDVSLRGLSHCGVKVLTHAFWSQIKCSSVVDTVITLLFRRLLLSYRPAWLGCHH